MRGRASSAVASCQRSPRFSLDHLGGDRGRRRRATTLQRRFREPFHMLDSPKDSRFDRQKIGKDSKNDAGPVSEDQCFPFQCGMQRPEMLLIVLTAGPRPATPTEML